jgi:serine/threonine-protein phosphatase 2A regulatory subunit B''
MRAFSIIERWAHSLRRRARFELETYAQQRLTRTGIVANAGNEMNAASKFPSSKLKLDELFLNWLSMSESQNLVYELLKDAKLGKPLRQPKPTMTASSVASAIGTPPRSPQKSGVRPGAFSPVRRPLSRQSSLSLRSSSEKQAIPAFYKPGGDGLSDEINAGKVALAERMFEKHLAGMKLEPFSDVVRDVIGLPRFFAKRVMKLVAGASAEVVTREQWFSYWNSTLRRQKDLASAMFEVLRKPNARALEYSDFNEVLSELVQTHPGLEFLQHTREFQERYIETVIYRIFYECNTLWNGKLTLRELKKSDLVEHMQLVEDEEDINRVLKYFSYEHFYVIYCKFWELDTDHDFYIDREDLLHYGNHALTYRIVARIFDQAGRPFRSKKDGKMCYEDFVWFILSEENKKHPLALQYWFKCIDTQHDDVITADEIFYFYEEQIQRMECLAQEPVLFEDILCQMMDMLKPEVDGRVTLKDLRASKMSGNFFNVLFNMNKFIAFETRDPFLMRQEREEPHLTEWDRFARGEYLRLSLEEDEEMEHSDVVWDNAQV